MKTSIQTNTENGVKQLIEMIDSCFTYGGADKESHNFERYILPYKNRLGARLFNSTYKKRLAELKKDYEIKFNVHTDYEGCSYNSLIKKN